MLKNDKMTHHESDMKNVGKLNWIKISECVAGVHGKKG